MSTRRTDWLAYGYSAAIVAGTGLLEAAFQQLHWADSEANTVMLLLAGLAWAAFRYDRGPAILASVLAVLVFDYCFVLPYYSFSVTDTRYLVTFVVMLSMGLLISTLASRLKIQIENTRQREQRTAALYQLGKQLSSLYGKAFLASAAGKTVGEMFHGEVVIYLRGQPKALDLVFGHETTIAQHPVSEPAAHWVAEHDQIAGAGTDTLPNAIGLFLPLVGSQRTFGTMAVRVADAEQLLEPDQRRLLEACANQLALALERDQLAIDAADAQVKAEAEQVRNCLLSSVSHDLKTPLAAIAGASSSLLESASLDEATRRQLLETVAEEATRLNRLLENILQMSKLDAGAAAPHKQWHVLEDIVGSALHRTRREVQSHPVDVRLSHDLPLLEVDGLLLEQVFVNLLENAARYTPPGSHIQISAIVDEKSVRIAVADNGPGLPPGSLERIFERFYRASLTADGGRGSGLGLAISRAIVKAHGGHITASNRPGGGAEFVIRLPLPQDAPQVDLD